MYGLSGTFSATQLKNAYKRMALIYHPDKPGGTKESNNKLKSGYKRLRPHASGTTMTLNEMLKERDAAIHIEKVETKISVLSNVRIPAPTRDRTRRVWFKSEIPEKMRAPEGKVQTVQRDVRQV
jgi:hypothetical protein